MVERALRFEDGLHRDWVAPLTSPPPVVPSLGPCLETETSSGAGFSTGLAGLTSTHLPTLNPLVTRAREIPFPRILSLSPHFQVLALGGRNSTALRPSNLCPVWLWNRARPFQSRLLLLSENRDAFSLSPFSSLSLLVSRFSHDQLCATPWTAAHQASSSLNLPIRPQCEILNPSPQNLLL